MLQPPAHKRRTYAGLITLTLVALLIFGGAAGAVMLGGAVLQPSGPTGAPAQRVGVLSSGTIPQVADDLA